MLVAPACGLSGRNATTHVRLLGGWMVARDGVCSPPAGGARRSRTRTNPPATGWCEDHGGPTIRMCGSRVKTIRRESVEPGPELSAADPDVLPLANSGELTAPDRVVHVARREPRFCR